jgi:glycosyltransferase involved in cell wall biosynthesis
VSEEDTLIAYFGRIYSSKGIETLLKAFQIVTQEHDKLRLVLIGGTIEDEFSSHSSYQEVLVDLSKQLGIQSKIIWTGEFSWDSFEGSRYLYAADLCVLPFSGGVYANNSSVAAVAAHGLPIITTKGATLDEQFVHLENVFLCRPEEPVAMASAMRLVIDDAALRVRLRQGALDLSQEWFSWDKATARTIQTLTPLRIKS